MEKVIRVFLVQCTRTGLFLDWEQNFVKSFRQAAITDQQQNALDTALMTFCNNEFEIHSIFVTEERYQRFHTVGFN